MVTLSYVHDPMCSWCWGYGPVWEQVVKQLPGGIRIRYVLGGLAPDTNEPMPDLMQTSIRSTWKRIQTEIPGTRFNFDFWTQCRPRRSTYPACRAVIAAREQQTPAEQAMILAIQQAYYLDARNPSDDEVLISLADSLGLDSERFSAALHSAATRSALLSEFEERDRLGARSFPSLFIEVGGKIQAVPLDYLRPESQLGLILDLARQADNF